MAHLHLAGDIVGGKHTHHSRQSLSLFLVDGQDSGPGVFAADGAAVNHAVQVNIIGIFAGAQDLLLSVHPGHGLAHTGAILFMRNLSAIAENLTRQQNGINNLLIARAAADIIADGKSSLLPGGVRVHIQQGLGGDDHARNAKAALHGPCLGKGPGIDLLFRVAQALYGENMATLQLIRGRDAGLGRLAVDQDMAGAAGALTAAILYGGEAQLIAQKAKQLLVFFRCDRLAVDKKRSHFCVLLRFIGFVKDTFCLCPSIYPSLLYFILSIFARKSSPFHSSFL